MTTKRIPRIKGPVAPAAPPPGTSEDDRAFDRWVEVIDFADAPGSEVEAALAQADANAAPLSPEFVDAAVARASMIPHRAVRRFRWLAAAAVLLGGVLLTAATALLLWPERQRSRITLDFAEAIALTQRSDHAAAYASAFKVLQGRLAYGIQALWRVSRDPDEDATLRNSTAGVLDALRVLMDSEERQIPTQVASDIERVATDVGNGGLPLESRLECLTRLHLLLRQGMFAIKFPATTSGEVEVHRDNALRAIRVCLDAR
jgi:hypothetical protein